MLDAVNSTGVLRVAQEQLRGRVRTVWAHRRGGHPMACNKISKTAHMHPEIIAPSREDFNRLGYYLSNLFRVNKG